MPVGVAPMGDIPGGVVKVGGGAPSSEIKRGATLRMDGT
jgi:hypothetical protein